MVCYQAFGANVRFLMQDLRDLQNSIRPSNTSEGDIVAALDFAIGAIQMYCRQLKYQKRIFLITSSRATISATDSQMEQVVKKLESNNTSLCTFIVGEASEGSATFDGLKRLDSMFTKEFGEDRHQLNSFENAASEAEDPVVKLVRPSKSYNGYLTLGLPESGRALVLAVEGYPCTRKSLVRTSSTYAVSSKGEPQSLETIYDYFPKPQPDEEKKDSNSGSEAIDKQYLESGYLYGSEIVYFGKEDKDLLLRGPVETTKGLSIIGFSPKRLVPR
jgi:ATP-dependent DNA helicase 2 subunit 2